MKVEYDDIDIKLFKSDPIGRVYLEYNDTVGGEPFNRCGVEGVDIDKPYGGEIGLYHECIKQRKTWEDLLGVKVNSDIMVEA